MYISILIAGFGGGILRGLVGFTKHQFSYKEVEFKPLYFGFMMFLSGLVGLFSAIVIKELNINFLGLTELTTPLAFIIGYAGGDFLENIYKIILKKPSLYSFPQDLKI